MIRFMDTFDKQFLLFINKNHNNKYLDLFYLAITNLSSNLFIFVLIIFLKIFSFIKPTNITNYIIISLLLSGTIIYLTKRIINRERPYQNIDGIKSIKIGVDKYSFPSGHSSAAFTIGTIFSLFASNYLISIFFIILSTLVAFSRIYLGVHYLTDTIAGSIIGALSSLVVYKIFI